MRDSIVQEERLLVLILAHQVHTVDIRRDSKTILSVLSAQQATTADKLRKFLC
jgi:hypothetical protein